MFGTLYMYAHVYFHTAYRAVTHTQQICKHLQCTCIDSFLSSLCHTHTHTHRCYLCVKLPWFDHKWVYIHLLVRIDSLSHTHTHRCYLCVKLPWFDHTSIHPLSCKNRLSYTHTQTWELFVTIPIWPQMSIRPLSHFLVSVGAVPLCYTHTHIGAILVSIWRV